MSTATGLLGICLFTVWCLWHLGIVGPRQASGQVRVLAARKDKLEKVEAMFKDAGLSYPAHRVFIRVFKKEQELELWARDKNQKDFTLITTYPICYVPGKLGPKRVQGDNQVPEGLYKVDRFNPQSLYHLSMGLDYPNRSDRVLGVRGNLGGDIFIHGECVSIGCIPIQNGPIDELYIACLDSKQKNSQAPIVHIFPCRMDQSKCKEKLEGLTGEDKNLINLWQDLEKIYAGFEKDHKLPEVKVDGKGRYVVK